MTARRGFTLVELVTVLAVVGILVTVALPPVRDAVDRARGAALVESVRNVQLAVAAAGEPGGAALRAAAGTVPSVLAPHLRENAFAPVGGIVMEAVQSSRVTLLVVRAEDQPAQRVLFAFHRLVAYPHTYTPRIALVPLTAVPSGRPSGPAATSPGTGTGGQQQPGTGTPTVTPPTVTPSTGMPTTGSPSTGSPSAGTPSTGTPASGSPASGGASGGNPVCSPNLPPGQYSHCASASGHGWFNNHNQGSGHGNH